MLPKKVELPNTSRVWLIPGLLLSWLGLAGFWDQVATWKNWFELGFFNHWREIKTLISTQVRNLTSVSIPTIVFDWLVFAIPIARGWAATFLNERRYIRDNPWLVELKGMGYLKEEYRPLNLCIGILVHLLFWPIVLFAMIDRLGEPKFKSNPASFAAVQEQGDGTVWRHFLLGILTFIPLLFLTTDFRATFPDLF